MGKIDSHISIMEEPKRAKDSEYLIRKRIKIDHSNIEIETPFKILDGKSITLNDATNIIEGIKKPIFECARRVEYRYNVWSNLYYLLTDASRDKTTGLNDFFSLRKDLYDNYPTVLSLVFRDDPFKRKKFVIKDENDEKKNVIVPGIDGSSYESLLDYIHTGSKAFVLSPDLDLNQESRINTTSYLNFIDWNMATLSEFNKKPIFAPLQVDLNERNTDRILQHYKTKGYGRIWINFNATHLSGIYFWRVRSLLRKLDRRFGLENVFLYYSHIKKESNPHIKDDSVLSSDIMPQFFASDFLGVNQASPRGGDKKEMEKSIITRINNGEFKNRDAYDEAMKDHRTRIFDPSSYYYWKIEKYPRSLPLTKEYLQRSQINKLFNSFLLRKEVENTKDFLFNNDNAVRPYLKKKKALKDNSTVMNQLVFEEKASQQTRLFEKLGKL